MGRLIDEDDVVKEIAISTYNLMDEEDNKQLIDDIRLFVPTAEPELCGYSIEHLTFIANAMREENITPKEVIDRLKDARLVAEILVEEAEEGLRQIMGGAIWTI